MFSRYSARHHQMKLSFSLVIALSGLIGVACSRSHSQIQSSPTQPIALELHVSVPFSFVAYGDTRFTDPRDTEASNPRARRALVQAIADAHPAFISIGGDISYNGNNENDWKIWDSETTIWRENK